jgi:hypothetical protein
MIPDFGDGVADWPQTLRPELDMDANRFASRCFRDGDFETGELGAYAVPYTLQDPDRCYRSADRRRDPDSGVDRDQAARFGIEPQLIDDTLAISVMHFRGLGSQI